MHLEFPYADTERKVEVLKHLIKDWYNFSKIAGNADARGMEPQFYGDDDIVEHYSPFGTKTSVLISSGFNLACGAGFDYPAFLVMYKIAQDMTGIPEIDNKAKALVFSGLVANRFRQYLSEYRETKKEMKPKFPMMVDLSEIDY